MHTLPAQAFLQPTYGGGDAKTSVYSQLSTTWTGVGDRCIQSAARSPDATWGHAQAKVALRLRQCVDTSSRSAMELFILWFQIPREEDLCIRAFRNGVARFSFGGVTVQVQPDRHLNVYQLIPYDIQPKVDPDLAERVRKYLIGYYAGNREAEMLERAMEALAFLGLGHGLDRILVIKDVGRKGKTARSVLRQTTFGSRASRLSASILITEEEARKQLSQHLYARVLDFDEFCSRDWLLRPILFALSGASPSSSGHPSVKKPTKCTGRGTESC